MRGSRAIIAGVAGAALLSPLLAAPAAEAANVSLNGTLTAVVDGDTVKVKTGPSTVLTVNLRGAVVGPACTPSAKSRLAAFVGTRVSLTASGSTGTVTATVISGQTNLSRRLVGLGVAAVGRTGGLTQAQINVLNQAQTSASNSKLGRFAPGGCGNDGLVAPAGWVVRGNLDALLLSIPAANRPTRAAFKTFVNQQSAVFAQVIKPGRVFAGNLPANSFGVSLYDEISLCAGGRFTKHLDANNAILTDSQLFIPSSATTVQSAGDITRVDTSGTFARIIDLRPASSGWRLNLTPTGGSTRTSLMQLAPNQSQTALNVQMFNLTSSGYATGPVNAPGSSTRC